MTNPMKLECMYVCNSVYILSFMASCGPVSCGIRIFATQTNRGWFMAVSGFQPMLNSNRIGHIMVAPPTRRHNLVAPFWRQLSTSKFMDDFCLVATTPGTMTSARVARLTSKQTCCYHPLPRMPSLGYCFSFTALLTAQFTLHTVYLTLHTLHSTLNTSHSTR